MKNVLLARYGEIALRGDNRNLYEKILIYNIRKNLPRYENFWVTKEQGRFLFETEGDIDYEYFIPRVNDVFGIVGVCPAIMTRNNDIDTICEAAVRSMTDEYGDAPIGTFKVETRRCDKRYPINSNEVSAIVGGCLLDRFPGLRVDLSHPDILVRVEIRTRTYVYSRNVPGLRGLPYGSSGKAVALLSGGIDSPVAAFLTARRGVEIAACYFHSPPFVSGRALEKVKDIANALSRYMPGLRMYAVPFTDVQVYLKEHVARERLTTFLKRAMLKTASLIAEKENALVLVTGDSIGQVASQTLQSINAIDSATDLPIIRPLSTTDKNDTVTLAKQIGTYDISITPYEDCCTIFVAEHPETKPKRIVIEGIENNLDQLDALINSAAENAEIFTFNSR